MRRRASARGLRERQDTLLGFAYERSIIFRTRVDEDFGVDELEGSPDL